MRALLPLLVAAFLLAGCSDAPAPDAPESSSSPGPVPIQLPTTTPAVPDEVTGEFHLLAAPDVATAVPVGADEILTPVQATYADPLGTETSLWRYTVQREGSIGTGTMVLNLRALHPVLLAAKTGSADSCSYILIIRVLDQAGQNIGYDSVGCQDAPGLQQAGDFTLTMDLAWGSAATNGFIPVEPGMTLEFAVGANYVDPQGGGLVVVSGTPDKDSLIDLPTMREPVAGLLGVATGADA